jgi:release factor glutamine methyltransferase
MPSFYKRIYYGDYVFFVDENVYEPAEDTFLFADNLKVEAGETVLDMGTGCGILGILAAEKAPFVLAADVNPNAIRYAKENAEFNNLLDKMSFIQGDLFTWLSDNAKFDVILFNVPYLPTGKNEVTSWIGRAWSGGVSGRQVIDRFISEVPKHLKRTGRVLLMQSTLANVKETISRLAGCYLLAEVVAECTLPFFETVVLIEARF